MARIDAGWSQAGLSERRVAMLGYAVKLTRSPGEVVSADLDALRVVGFSDRDILDIAEVVAYYAYANRIADGLGIELEDWYPDETVSEV